jgi:ATP-dependent phosphofructokinase / diphosphate-dependent phosphofructokinase
MKIGVLTGGGDVPGLNAAIRAVARRSYQHGWDVIAIKQGWAGLVKGIVEPLTPDKVSGILHVGGTILGASRTNPLKKEADMQACFDNLGKYGIDALVAIGGDDTLSVALGLYERGVKVVGVPKTMDNDVAETEYCIGFDTATNVVADALDKLHTTASAHHRIIVVEVMGRHAGWVATVGGLAGGADLILIPETPMTLEQAANHVKKRWERGKQFSIIVVAEGAQIPGIVEDESLTGDRDAFGHIRLDRRGLGETVARELEKLTGFETRAVVLGHLQRGGSPTVFDRMLATRLGVGAIQLVREERFGYMVALKANKIVPVLLKDALAYTKTVDPELYQLAASFY